MTAPYDTYDYPSYWKEREYEHESEIIALKHYLNRISHIKSLIEIGSGFGRLTQEYAYRAKRIVLSDPSLKLLNMAKRKLKNSNILFIHSKIENLPKTLKHKKFDVVILIRVLHHLWDIEKDFKIVSKLLNKKGYFILEFANKRHFKATFLEFLRGNFTFPLDIFPKDIRCKKNIKIKTLPFFNYHPDKIYKMLETQGFTIIEKRSVSNMRHNFLKKHLPLSFLLQIEMLIQAPLGKLNFGPSIFLLCRK